MLRPITIALMISAAAAGRPGPQSADRLCRLPATDQQVSTYRQARLLSWSRVRASWPGSRRSLILDARSADAYAAGHIRGAVNLPFTDFTADSLARVIGDKRPADPDLLQQ